MLVIGATVYLEIINIYILAGLVLLTGMCYPADMITRRAFISTIVLPKYITKGLSVDVINFMIGSIVGPISVGFLLTFTNVSVAYTVMGVIYLTGVCTILFVKTKATVSSNELAPNRLAQSKPTHATSPLSDLKSVSLYVYHHPPLMAALIIVIVANAVSYTHLRDHET